MKHISAKVLLALSGAVFAQQAFGESNSAEHYVGLDPPSIGNELKALLRTSSPSHERPDALLPSSAQTP